jgi:UDP-4-amino-4,6-dideoxy-N-acetyl-beta-L-altrosamine transaminase
MIPYGRQDISEADVQAVVNVLRSDFLTQGPTVPAFEHAVATYCGAGHAVAVNSATSALHLACLALGVGPGDRVWTSPLTFVATANSALHCGAQVDFVDIDPDTCNISVTRLAEKLAHAEQEGRLPKTLIPVHLCGQPCEMEAIHALGQRYGFTIIEDAAHAIGSKYKGVRTGNGRYSDITVFSFHPVKIVTTAEGGMALTNDAGLARKIQRLRSHGITRDPAEMTHPPDGPWYYQQVELGFNFRMTELQGVLGLSQMQRLDAFLGARRALAARYDEKLLGLPLVTPRQHPDSCSAWHLYVVRVQTANARKSRREVFDALRAANIGVNVHYIPVPSQPYFERMGFQASSWPEAERYYSEAISLPLFATLTELQQDRVIAGLRSALE